MDLKLHANATTTPRIRGYIQQSRASNAALARELGIHSRTVARWKARAEVLDRSTRPHRLATTMSDWEEALVVELRRSLALPLDDITEAMRRCVNPKLSRSAIHRCLQRHAIAGRATPDKAPAAAFHTDAPAGFIHIDVKYLPPLNRRRSYAYVAIDRATRFVYLEILPDRRAATAAGFLDRFRVSFPLTIHTVLTDNGSEFTDRFAVDKKGKPHDKPSGAHPFDLACAEQAITHRLTRPFRPQTNGMVERFNRRLGDHLDRMPQNRTAHHRRFRDHAERDAYLATFVADYNRTRLRCLGYQAPAELLANLTGHNTQAGVLWLFLFHPSFGIVGSTLRRVGIDWNYLLNGRQALALVALAAAWKQIGYNFLFFLAGLQAIPKSLLEAAALDGAGAARRFWHITSPLLAPTSFFLLVVNLVYAFFDTFGIIQNVTQGGPARATEILVYKVWYDGVVGLDLGGSAAQSVILLAIVSALTAVQFRFVERRVHYG